MLKKFDEIDGMCQFHQPFLYKSLFSAQSLALNELSYEKRAGNVDENDYRNSQPLLIR